MVSTAKGKIGHCFALVNQPNSDTDVGYRSQPYVRYENVDVRCF